MNYPLSRRALTFTSSHERRCAAGVVAVIVAVFLFSACGADSSASGPSLTGGADATAATDAVIAADAKVGDGGGGSCGDNVCDPTESTANCPADCTTDGATGTKACLATNCQVQLTACETSLTKTCAAFVACASACKDLTCVQICVQKGGEPDQRTKRVIQCGSTNACFALESTCGDGTCDPGENSKTCAKDCKIKLPVCGNGTCEKGETPTNCKSDCKNGGPVCGNGTCEAGETHDACPFDCNGNGPVCGNGSCEPGESPSTCSKDCKIKTYCGNGHCDAGETPSNCKQDCGGGSVAPMTCAEQKCPTQFAACLKSAPCSKLVKCFSACKLNDASCYGKCGQAVGNAPPPAFQVLGQCAQKACGGGGQGQQCGDGQCTGSENSQSCPSDCKPPVYVCGNGKCEKPMENSFSCPKDCKGQPAVCGNGKCEPGESEKSCSADCGAQGVLTCAKQKCSANYSKCAKSKSCNKALVCMGSCKNTSCLQSCAVKAGGDLQTFFGLAQCAQKSGCLTPGGGGAQCGNGKCEQGETSKNCAQDCKAVKATCKGYCGKKSAGDCWCDAKCAQAGDCCSDRKQYCAVGATCGNNKCEPGESAQSCPKDCLMIPTAKCGDGVCQAPLENSKNCPKDCGVPPAKSCKSKSDCSPSEVCCGKPQGQVCVPSGQCF